jgi:hypothetical protein
VVYHDRNGVHSKSTTDDAIENRAVPFGDSAGLGIYSLISSVRSEVVARMVFEPFVSAAPAMGVYRKRSQERLSTVLFSFEGMNRSPVSSTFRSTQIRAGTLPHGP